MRAGRLRRLRAAVVLIVMAAVGLLTVGPVSVAQASTVINGQGSTYAYPALNQWATDLSSQGLGINYAASGSAQGRQQYIAGQDQFAGSDIAFLTQGDADPFSGVDINHISFAYSYIPDVAGGLSFLYNLQVGGQRIRNLRLSGNTLAQIYTGHITNWDNAAITRDYGKQLPSIPITVVTRSDGAGESYFLSNWLLHEYPSLWVPFCKSQGGVASECNNTPTEYYPHNSSGFRALNLSDAVVNYVNSPVNNGAIGYAEEAYAIPDNVPVVSMLNAAGYFVQPTAANVAVALHSAIINSDQNSVDFLMQNLNSVYGDRDPRTYPLSSYSYLIVPRDSRSIGRTTYHALSNFTSDMGVTLSKYTGYILCQAQQSAQGLGYSPLPKPMVLGGFTQYNHIPGHVSNPAASGNYNSCNNPAYHNGVDTILANAPMPLPCQKYGTPLNCVNVGNRAVAAGPSNNGPNNNGGPRSSNPNANPSASSTNPAGGNINPVTGLPENTSDPNANETSAQSVNLASRPAEEWLFGVLTAVVLIGAVTVPATLGPWLERRRRAFPGGRGTSAGEG